MKKHRILNIFLYSIILLSFLAILVSINLYLAFENSFNEKILEDYNYDSYQEIVISEDEKDAFPEYDKDAMLQVNEDFVGWIYIPDTPVNYPVVQGTDNSYYLKHTIEKEYSKFGCIFMMAGVEYNANNIVLHGHNMGQKREEMFSSLLRYEDAEFTKEHDTISFSHIEEDTVGEYEIFAIVNYNFYNPENFNYMIPNFEDEEAHADFVDYLLAESMHKTDKMYPDNKQLLILSTCYSIYGENNRMLVCAYRVN